MMHSFSDHSVYHVGVFIPGAVDAPSDHSAKVPPADTNQIETLRGAIELWLRWNDAQEGLTAEMFRGDHRPQAIEDLLDRVDQMRQEAVRRSRALLK